MSDSSPSGFISSSKVHWECFSVFKQSTYNNIDLDGGRTRPGQFNKNYLSPWPALLVSGQDNRVAHSHWSGSREAKICHRGHDHAEVDRPEWSGTRPEVKTSVTAMDPVMSWWL